MSTKPASNQHQASEEKYRNAWKWDKVTWGCHAVDCYPGGCPWRVYSKDGKIVREEQAGIFPTIEPGVPDMNPMGCQKGAAWSQQHYNEERVLYPMKRAGKRGEGKWQRVSWQTAFTEIADAMLDAIQEQGPQSCYHIGTPGEGGTQQILWNNFSAQLGFQMTDLQAEINDFSPGIYTTFGKFDPAPGADDFFKTELVLIWHANPVYTNMTWYHFMQEARYNGGEVVTIAPDFSPSAVHADIHVPIEIGTDSAFANAMSQVVIEERLVDYDFVKRQTDLPLLVRTDTKRFLRAADLAAGGSNEQFYWLDAKTGSMVEAPRGTLDPGTADPALEGRLSVKLADGTSVEVRPVFELLRDLLNAQYTPEKVQALTGIHPDTTRKLARKIAKRRTRIMMGWNSGKYYHGDLMERSMMLILGLTGNWGKHGTGARSWAVGLNDGMFTVLLKSQAGPEMTLATRGMADAMVKMMMEADPTVTDEIAKYEVERQMTQMMGFFTPPALFWYHHCGYREIWNRKGYGDPGMKRTFDEYFNEAMEKGWWAPMDGHTRNAEPRFLVEVGGNLLRRQRGGARQLLEHLWPKLKMIVSVDWRINTTGLWADYILPAAQHYEKTNQPYSSPMHLHVLLIEKAAEPQGEAKSEWQIIQGVAKALETRSKERGLPGWNRKNGEPVPVHNLWNWITKGGDLADDDRLIDEIFRDSALLGTIPADTTLDSMRKHGAVRAVGWGNSAMMVCQQSPIEPNKTHTPFRNHIEQLKPYPTLNRRASFYIDHEWYLEAGEELPVHKDNPHHGGEHPLRLTSGHPRWSIHSMNHTSSIMLGTHRGYPVMYMNPDDMKARGLNNDDEAVMVNDLAEMRIRVRLSPGTKPGQVVVYNGYEPFQFKQWKGPENIEPGMVKWLHFAGGYGHLQYRGIHWQPIPIDRAVHVDVRKA
ncbi:MAG: molybdopterin-dependent oxidoreductase [Deltaproteobacteria bacterium]|nr:molybdopterin-dependent oxidoreductase [Deltaproteobacteria bacterium]